MGSSWYVLLRVLRLPDSPRRRPHHDPYIFLTTGNPPLHVALQLGRKEIAELLLNAGASCATVNAESWDALDEAMILGDRPLLERMTRQFFEEEMDKLLALPNGPWEKFNEVSIPGLEEHNKERSPLITHPHFHRSIVLSLPRIHPMTPRNHHPTETRPSRNATWSWRSS